MKFSKEDIVSLSIKVSLAIIILLITHLILYTNLKTFTEVVKGRITSIEYLDLAGKKIQNGSFTNKNSLDIVDKVKMNIDAKTILLNRFERIDLLYFQKRKGKFTPLLYENDQVEIHILKKPWYLLSFSFLSVYELKREGNLLISENVVYSPLKKTILVFLIIEVILIGICIIIKYY